MEKNISLTSSGQLHIPKAFRDALKLDSIRKFSLRVEGDELILKPQRSKLLDLAGAFQGRTPTPPDFNPDHLRDFVDYGRE